MKIKYILEVIKSAPDKWGYTYYAFTLTNTENRNFVKGKFGGSGGGVTIQTAIRYLNGGEYKDNCYYTNEVTMKIRDFNRYVKMWQTVELNAIKIAGVMSLVNDDRGQGAWMNNPEA